MKSTKRIMTILLAMLMIASLLRLSLSGRSSSVIGSLDG